MKKITDLTEKRTRPAFRNDAYGNRQRIQEEFTAPVIIKTVAPGPRFAHFIIDMIAFQAVFYVIDYLIQVVFNAVSFSPSLDLTVGLIYGLFTLLAYAGFYAIFEWKFQRTPAKWLTKTVVIDEYGNKPDLRTILLRSLIRYVPFEQFTFFDDNSRGWHDRWSNTWVVKEEELKRLKQMLEEEK